MADDFVTLESLLGIDDVAQVLGRLKDHALGLADMSATEVQAAKIYIGKKMPDVKAVELTGKNGGPVKIEGITVTLVKADAG